MTANFQTTIYIHINDLQQLLAGLAFVTIQIIGHRLAKNPRNCCIDGHDDEFVVL